MTSMVGKFDFEGRVSLASTQLDDFRGGDIGCNEDW